MGTIKVGKNNPKEFRSSGWTSVTETAAPLVMSEERKAEVMESLKDLPESEWVATLRNHGLVDEANECERSLAEKHLHELGKEARERRLAEIMSMPSEEQLSLLIEEGFEEEAKVLAKKLSEEALDIEKTDDGNGEENQPQDGVVGCEPMELSTAEDEKKEESKAKDAPKRGGRKPGKTKK
jgi:hypothetical protein